MKIKNIILLLLATASFCRADLTTGLVASYPFSGNANDVSGYGFHGTVSGAALTADRFGRSNSAYSFNGSTAYISCPTVLPNFQAGGTIACWIKTSKTSSIEQAAVCQPRPFGDVGGLRVGVWNGKADTGFNNDNGGGGSVDNIVLQPATTCADGSWHHLVSTVNGSVIRFYVDGVFIASRTYTNNGVTTSARLQIGREGTSVRYFSGSIDDVSIYNRALSAAEVTSLYNNQPSSTNGLVGRYTFTGNANDVSGNGFNGIPSNATLTTDRFGNSNRAFSFNGTTNFIADSMILSSTTSPLVQNNFTVSIWFKAGATDTLQVQRASGTSGYSQRYMLFPINSGASSGIGISAGTNGISVFEQGNGFLPAVLVYPHAFGNSWVHAVVTVAANGAPKLYINGVHVATGLNSGRTKRFTPFANTSEGIGGGNYGHFKGSLDELRVYNRALSADEISNIYSTESAISGLVGRYTFTGNANDVSGNGFNGIPSYATLTTDRFGNPNRAYSFNGTTNFSTDSEIRSSTTSPLVQNNFTVSIWFKAGATDTLNSQQTSGTYGYSQRYMVGGVQGGASSGISLSAGTNGFSVFEHGNAFLPAVLVYRYTFGTSWVHAAVTVASNGAPLLYINGVHVATGLSTGRTKAFCPFTIGGGGYGHFKGSLDELRVYNRALSASEISNIYATESVK